MQLRDTTFKDLFLARIKKTVLDMTSVKFEFVVFLGYAMWVGKVPPIYALPAMMIALGMREYVDFFQKKNENPMES
jgi:hypothetical protein